MAKKRTYVHQYRPRSWFQRKKDQLRDDFQAAITAVVVIVVLVVLVALNRPG